MPIPAIVQTWDHCGGGDATKAHIPSPPKCSSNALLWMPERCKDARIPPHPRLAQRQGVVRPHFCGSAKHFASHHSYIALPPPSPLLALARPSLKRRHLPQPSAIDFGAKRCGLDKRVGGGGAGRVLGGNIRQAVQPIKLTRICSLL